MELEHVTHDFQPIYNGESRILMLGTMPSPKSREVGFYYGHPRNRFWKVVPDVCGEALPVTKEEKILFALKNKIAVWDVLAGCEIRGAEDSSIRNPIPNDMNLILEHSDIQAILRQVQRRRSYIRNIVIRRRGYKQSACLLPVLQTVG